MQLNESRDPPSHDLAPVIEPQSEFNTVKNNEELPKEETAEDTDSDIIYAPA